MKITVLHLLHQLGFGGTERVVVNLLNHSGGDFRHLICSFYPCDPEFLKEVHDGGRSVFCLDKKTGNDLQAPFKIASLCRAQSVDIVHSLGWSTYAEGLAAAHLHGKKRPFIHSFRGKTNEDLNGLPLRRVIAQRFFSRFCSAILCPSELSRSEYSEMIGLDPQAITVIYNGVDSDRFKPDSNASSRSKRMEFGLDEEEIVIGSVGRFDPVKNMGGLVRAFSMLPSSSREKCRLLLVGDGPELNEVKQIAESHGLAEKAVFPGMLRSVPECLRLMDVYVQPSKFEGVPNALLEAMATGLPVVATDVGGVREIVLDGETGILVKQGDERALANSIESLLRDLKRRASMGVLARESVVTRFSIEAMVSAFEGACRRILS